MNFKTAYREEGCSLMGSYGIEINIAQDSAISSELARASSEASRLIKSQMTREFFANDKESQLRAKEQRIEILSLFEQPIYVTEIPNGYCHDACCEHLPWFVVTTKIGPIKIGWRKSVISIDWSETKAPDAEILFPKEDVTKHGQLIHAWGYEKAKEYISVLMQHPNMDSI